LLAGGPSPPSRPADTRPEIELGPWIVAVDAASDALAAERTATFTNRGRPATFAFGAAVPAIASSAVDDFRGPRSEANPDSARRTRL